MNASDQTVQLSTANLGKEKAIFPASSFFKDHATLPSPSTVRKEAAKTKNLPGRWAHKPWVVPFFQMKLVVKYGPSISISEGKCLHSIRTSLGHRLPVPEVYGWCRDGGDDFVYMQLVDGPTLESAWDGLTHQDRAHIHHQLRRVVLSLRSLRQPPDSSFVGNIARQPLRDHIFEECKRPAGPFATVRDFNDYFINLLWTAEGLPDPHYVHPQRPGLPDKTPVVFTHADLTPSNIIISSSPSGQPTIAAVIDWHQSGWYPAYWESCKSISNADPKSEWGRGLADVFAPYGEVLKTYRWMISAGVAI